MARKPGNRGLTEAERSLWSKVVSEATPLPRKDGPAPERPPAKGETPPEPAPSTPPPLRPFAIGERAQPSGHRPAPLVPNRIQMDAKAFGKLRRGKLEPDARIDLHGMTVSAAHAALVAFILRSRATGHRLVLVITGKGRDAQSLAQVGDQRGVLRRQVPHWLETPPIVQAVLQVATAHARHGGSGAYYVYLRRRQ